jgi:hypothetical protein
VKAQEYEDRSNLRIKFASVDPHGFLVRDASEEYDTFFDETPERWSVKDADRVNTLRYDGNRAWFLRTDGEELVAVEHETGIEFLLAVGASVASTAVVEMVSWAWTRWRNSREEKIRTGSRVEATLVLESVEDRFPDGRIRRSRKVEVHGPIDEAAAAAALAQWAH